MENFLDQFNRPMSITKAATTSPFTDMVKQPRNPWSNGPEYITQCPIFNLGTNSSKRLYFLMGKERSGGTHTMTGLEPQFMVQSLCIQNVELAILFPRLMNKCK
ncbi:hypothetical protein Pyn_40021 [Prunus yedoensis var. nudiflora]|uniref:Uncharacterized protein n=1 Tax=Prunus yedoensis var. nudiflora TaxID=2094558 RepID=A0A314U8H0_PRUYE|nr:hypothetical protein Pyn_40021 [Prunus yedoensis var. nudiflora]